MKKLGVNYSTYRETYPTILKYPFSSSRKRMSVLLKSGSENYLFVKGASEMVLGCCNKWYDMKNNRVESITESLKGKMEENIKKMAESSLRTLCLAYRKISSCDDLQCKDEKGVFSV
jgi:magnesium-transporting ATPase (P-type)